jgi:hypothetical protein
VDLIRKLVAKRLMDSAHVEAGQRELDQMLATLWRAGYVTLEPEPPKKEDQPPPPPQEPSAAALLGAAITGQKVAEPPPPPPPYKPLLAHPTAELPKLLLLRSVNPLYGMFLINQLGIADRAERIQAIESVLELPRSVGYYVHVPRQNVLPPGPLATTRLDPLLLQLGLATAEELSEAARDEQEEDQRRVFEEDRVFVLTLADKLRRLFEYEYSCVPDLRVSPVWAAGELIEFGGDFNKYVTSKSLQKQEGVIFRHLLRLILLIGEFKQFCPPDTTEDQWQADLDGIASTLTESCRRVDPTSTEKVLAEATSSGVADAEL